MSKLLTSLTLPEQASPGTPASGFVSLFGKADGLYYKNSGGAEYKIGLTTNMVTTDTVQTISGAKTFTGAVSVPDGTFSIAKVSTLTTALDNRVTLATAQTISGAKTFTSNITVDKDGSMIRLHQYVSTGLNRAVEIHAVDAYGNFAILNGYSGITLAASGGTRISGQASGDVALLVRATTGQTGDLQRWSAPGEDGVAYSYVNNLGHIYDNGNRVYSGSNPAPAPSNMVTTDTNQTVTATKTHTGQIIVQTNNLTVQGSTSSLTLEHQTAATSAALTRDTSFIRFRTKYWNGSANVNEDLSFKGIRNSTTPGDYHVAVQDHSGTAIARFTPTGAFYAAALYDNNNRVYSDGNKVPVSGISATGTASATTYLRGDGSWATVSTGAPANMATTDTSQTISGWKTFSAGLSTSSANFELGGASASAGNTLVNSDRVKWIGRMWNGASQSLTMSAYVIPLDTSFSNSSFKLSFRNETGNVEIASLRGDGVFTAAHSVASTLSSTGLTGATQASRYVGATTSGAPTTGTFAVGDYVISLNGRIWVCTTAGSPGTWTDVGTSSAPSNMVTTDTVQTISGNKTFTGTITVPDLSFAVSKISATGTASGTTYLRGDGTWATVASGTAANVVTSANATAHKATVSVSASPPAAPAVGDVWIIPDVNTGAAISAGGSTPANMVTTDTTQTISATKTFSTGVVALVAPEATGLASSQSTRIDFTSRVWANFTSTDSTGSLQIVGNPIDPDDPLFAFTSRVRATAFHVTGLGDATATSRYVGATTTGAPTWGTFIKGDYVIAQNGRVWICTTAGSPGTWTDAGTSTAPANMVTTDTTQTISGTKTFNVAPVVPDSSFTVAKISATGTASATTVLLGNGTWGALPLAAISATGTRDATTHLRGDGTWGSVAAPPIPFSFAGTITTKTGSFKFPIAAPCTIESVQITAGTASVGASIIADVNRNGTTIFTTQGNRPTLTAGSVIATAPTPDVTSLAAGDYITVDIDQIGTTTAGADVMVVVRIRRT